MRLNGKPFEIYATDTESTILKRMARAFGSIPRWLITRPKTISPTTADVEVVDALGKIRNARGLAFPDVELPEAVKREEAERIFVATNAVLNEADPSNVKFFLLGMRGFAIDPDAAWAERREIERALDKELKENERLANEFENEADKFASLPVARYTEFELDHVQFTVNFGNTTKSTVELFNAVVLTKNVPYCAYGSLYKLFREFRINPAWLDLESKNVILLKVNGNKFDKATKNPFKKYTNAAFTVTSDGALVATMDVNVGNRYLSKEEFVERTLKVFGLRDEPVPTSAADNMAIAYFSFPNACLEVSVFNELTMNDPTFNALIAVDEFVRASKIKQNVYVHVLATNETASIQTKRTDKYNQYGMESIGEPYVRCRVQAKSVAGIIPVQNLLGKLLNLYNAKRADVVAQYRRYIPDFLLGKERCAKKKERTKPMGLRELAPEIFFPKYSRKCIYRPTIVSDEAAGVTDRQVMRFPTKGESVERNYVCDIETHPFPGLRENSLENKSEFPFVPCCYSKDQREKMGTNYRRYFMNEVVDEKIQNVQQVYSTNKILPPNVLGTLPKRVREAFSTLDPDSSYYYARKGVNRSKFSAVEAVLKAKGRGEDVTMDVVRAERERLTAEKYAMACKQETYDESADELARQDYDVAKFVRALETAYDCDVFVFGPADGDGELMVPRHAKAYYKYKPSRETIFLYRHFGSESDHAEYAQCELIVKIRLTNLREQIGAFVSSDVVVRGVYEIFREQSRFYVANAPAPPLRRPNFTVTSQCVDAYGKCRLINVLNEDREITCVVDPLPPFAAVALTIVKRASTENVESFARRWKLTVDWQRVNASGRVREVGISGAIVGVALTDDARRIEGVTVVDDAESYPMMSSRNANPVTEFVDAKRKSKLLYSYALRAYSKFVDKTKSTDYKKFVAERVRVDPSARYSLVDVSSAWSRDSSFVSNDGRVIVPSEEALRRLLFMIELFARYRRDRLLELKDAVYIPNYYDEITDFDAHPNQHVLEGAEAVRNVTESYDASYAVTDAVKPDAKNGYFFKNELVGDEMYLAQNCDGVYEASAVCDAWLASGYNAFADKDELNARASPIVSARIYKYVNEKEIVSIRPAASRTALLGYKINGAARYTALLPL